MSIKFRLSSPIADVNSKLLVFLCTNLLVACSSFAPNNVHNIDRGVPFALHFCNEQRLELARSILAAKETAFQVEPRFDETWVCRTAPNSLTKNFSPNELEAKLLEDMAFQNEEEHALRAKLEAPFLRDRALRPKFGIALSGGGTKAAAVATGVLAGLSDIGILDSADYISSVSGGGYAGYFYYAQKLMPRLRWQDYEKYFEQPPTSADIYRDCVFLPEPEESGEELRNRIKSVGGCRIEHLLPDANHGSAAIYRYQAFLRCQQDVFRPGNCNTGVPRRELPLHSAVFTGTLVGIVPAFISGTLFDWGYTVSPAARIYHDGIGIAYGTAISEPDALRNAERKNRFGFPCERDRKDFVIGCVAQPHNPKPQALTFAELRRGLLDANENRQPLPFWIINAAAPKRRNIFGWVAPVPRDLSNSDMFEMTAVSHGSGRYGYVSAPPSLYRMSVLDSVAASAAFMDANNLILGPATRGILGIAAHLAALDWGQDIPNYNTGDRRRFLHRSLPVPLNWLDSQVAQNLPENRGNFEMEDRARSVYIRLMDGGNAENLGVFSLLKRGTQTIVVSDAAVDEEGRFDDVCGLARRISSARNHTLGEHFYIPGLGDFHHHCTHNLEHSKAERRGYDLHNWPFEHDVLVGCLRRVKQEEGKNPCGNLKLDTDGGDTRFYIIKPAVNNKIFASQFLPPQEPPRRKFLRDCWVRGFEGPQSSAKLLNCDTAAFMAATWEMDKGDCQVFPQHSTVQMTVNSSDRQFAAYRELSRQQVTQSALKRYGKNDDLAEFERISHEQWITGNQFKSRSVKDQCTL